VIPRRRVASQEHSPERGRPPRVFISYSHDSPEHARRVLGLADRLRNDGIDAILDQYEVSPKEGWMLWMEREIEQANYVLLVCTAPYLRRVMKREAKGVGWECAGESHIVYQYLYEDGNLNWRFLPVLFKSGQVEHIPRPCAPTRGTAWIARTGTNVCIGASLTSCERESRLGRNEETR